jgi:molybdate transport repressor ModE-like protein
VEIRELRVFIAVIDEGSLSAAARKLHLSQSALSQTILSLERQLGVQLLERHSTGVTATDAGTILLREARALIAQHDRALAAVTGQTAVSPGNLRVGVPLELPADLLPRASGTGRRIPANPRRHQPRLQHRAARRTAERRTRRRPGPGVPRRSGL